MTKEMTAYKLFYRQEDGDNKWLSSLNVARDYRLRYEQGQKTEAPRGTKLLVFQHVEAAREFIYRYNQPKTGLVLCRVTCGDRLTLLNWVAGIAFHRTADNKIIKEFWRRFKMRKHDAYFQATTSPYGTLACDWVIPLEEINAQPTGVMDV